MSARIIPILLALAALLTACGTEATPTMSPADVQGTAVAAAWTVVAATQRAIPTDTLPPPTETPSLTPPPTFTSVSISTLAAPATSTPVVAAAGTDTCLHPLNMGEAGPKRRVRIENESGGTFNLSLNLWTPNAFGQCGALYYSNQPKYARFIVEMPAGSWFAYAWITLPGGKSSEAPGSFVIGTSKSDDIMRLVIKKDVIGFYGP